MFILLFLLFVIICALAFSKSGGSGGFKEKINDILKKIDSSYGILISHNGKIIFEKYEENNENTKFRIFSLSKPINALAIFILASNNKLKLTDTINKFEISIPNAEKITINHLLNHTSGVYDFSSELYFQKNPKELFEKILKKNETDFIEPNQALQEINKNEPYFKPQDDPFEVDLKNYNNTGYDLLGYIIYKVSGLKTDEYIKQNIFEKLNMNKASFQFKKDQNESIPFEEKNAPGIKEQQNWWCGNGQIVCTLKDYDKFLNNYEKLLSTEFLKKYQQLYYFSKKKYNQFSHEGGGDFSHSHSISKEKNTYRTLSRSLMLKIFDEDNNVNIIISENYRNETGFFKEKYKIWNEIVDTAITLI